MEEVAKYARLILNSIEKRPAMHGGGAEVEMQYLTALEFLAIAEGFDVKTARESYFRALSKRFKTSVRPAFTYDIPLEEIVSIIKEARPEIDPSMWIDMTDDAIGN